MHLYITKNWAKKQNYSELKDQHPKTNSSGKLAILFRYSDVPPLFVLIHCPSVKVLLYTNFHILIFIRECHLAFSDPGLHNCPSSSSPFGMSLAYTPEDVFWRQLGELAAILTAHYTKPISKLIQIDW